MTTRTPVDQTIKIGIQSINARAINLADYEHLILKMSARCRRKLPRTSCLELEDLQQEGRVHALYVAGKFDPNRGVKFSTILTFGLAHRYGRILHEEWKRAFTAGPGGLDQASEPAGQRQVEVALSLEVKKVGLPDRYGKLQKRLCLSYRASVWRGSTLVEPLEPLDPGRRGRARPERLLAELPARPRLAVEEDAGDV